MHQLVTFDFLFRAWEHRHLFETTGVIYATEGYHAGGHTCRRSHMVNGYRLDTVADPILDF